MATMCANPRRRAAAQHSLEDSTTSCLCGLLHREEPQHIPEVVSSFRKCQSAREKSSSRSLQAGSARKNAASGTHMVTHRDRRDVLIGRAVLNLVKHRPDLLPSLLSHLLSHGDWQSSRMAEVSLKDCSTRMVEAVQGERASGPDHGTPYGDGHACHSQSDTACLSDRCRAAVPKRPSSSSDRSDRVEAASYRCPRGAQVEKRATADSSHRASTHLGWQLVAASCNNVSDR